MIKKRFHAAYLKFRKILLLLLCMFFSLAYPVGAVQASVYASAAGQDPDQYEQEEIIRKYQEYRRRFHAVKTVSDIEANDYQVIEDQIFLIELEYFGEVNFIPALDVNYSRLALFLADDEGNILYKTDQLETNNRNLDELVQQTKGIAAVSFQDVNGDGLTDVVLITYCENEAGTYAGNTYKVGDVLFQNKKGFYRDYRISDKINRFSMNKSIEFITAFVRDGYSTEFLYTATTLEELKEHGFDIFTDQYLYREFEKLGKLRTVLGMYTMADYDIFMIYLVNEQGFIVWSFQPMGRYDNLYALKGFTCKDIDGDGLRDVMVLGRYSYEGSEGELLVDSVFAIYYQRTGGFTEETEYGKIHLFNEEDNETDTAGGEITMAELVKKARAYWGWSAE